MHDRDTELLARTAAALRAEGKHEQAGQLEAAVARTRRQPQPAGAVPIDA